MEQADTLRTIAEVATAFAGFSGVVLVLGNRTEREWSYVETGTISLLLFFSLGVVFFALVPLLVEAAGVPAWRISNGLIGIYHLALIIWVGTATRVRTDRLLLSRWVAIAAMTGGFGTVVFNLLVAAGALQPLSFFAYLVAIVWLLAMAAMMFAALLFESRRGVAEPAAATC